MKNQKTNSDKQFVHLNVHTYHSPQGGCFNMDKLLARAKELSMPAIAITDTGNIGGGLDFYLEAKKLKIKPILGCQIFYVNDHKTFKKPKLNSNKVDDVLDFSPRSFPHNQIFHKTLLAKNYKGFLNLTKLLSKAWISKFYCRPVIDFELLSKYSDGIIALSGSMNGVASQYLLYSDYKNAKKSTANFLDIFGKENYFIEIQNHFLQEQEKINSGLFKLSKDFDLKCVATNNVYYINKADYKAYDSMLCKRTGKVLSDSMRLKLPCNEFYLKSANEMDFAFPNNPKMLENTLYVADLIDIKIPEYTG